MSDNNNNKAVLPLEFKYDTGSMSLLFFIDELNSFKNLIGRFEVTMEILDSKRFAICSTRMLNFIRNLHGTLFISTMSPKTPNFVDGTFELLNIEIPTEMIDSYFVSAILYYKCNAILNGAGRIKSFSFVQEKPIEVSINLDLEELDRDNPFVDEDIWVEDLNVISDEDGEEHTLEDSDPEYISKPWWRRNDGEVRDFFTGISEDIETVQKFCVYLGEEDTFTGVDKNGNPTTDSKDNVFNESTETDDSDDSDNNSTNGPNIVSL